MGELTPIPAPARRDRELSMKKVQVIHVALLWMQCVGAQVVPTNSTAMPSDSTAMAEGCTHRPWRALGEVALTCGAVHSFARYVMKEDYAQSTIHSIRDNVKSGFAWDDDNFYLNNIGHTYQGSAYFNAARSNGLSFWQSVPYTFLGALAWEITCEKEQPSINDMIVTPVSGVLMGEISHRLVPAIVDERERGAKRATREALAAITNPIEGLHRLFSGRMWKVGSSKYTPLCGTASDDDGNTRFAVGLGDRCIAPANDFALNTHQPYASFSIEYGNAADGEPHTAIYDYFTVDGAFAFGKRQHLLSHLDITGRICSTPVKMNEKTYAELGLYQFFRYEDTHLKGDSTHSPFPYGEMASFGPGIIFSFPHLSPHIRLEENLFTRGVVLGAVNSDYYKFHNRTYNMGTGYGASSTSLLKWENVGSLQMSAYYMHLFTWKGYEPKHPADYTFENKHFNVLGDKSHARLLSISLKAIINLSQHMGVAVGASYHSRNTHYKHHENRRAESCDIHAGLEWDL